MRRRLTRGRRGADGGLSAAALAPMVDMMTMLLVFLLRVWSTDPPLDLAEAETLLPVSRAEAPVHTGVVVDVGTSGLYVDGQREGSVAYHLDSEETLIREVYAALQARGGTRVVVRADQGTPWRLLGKVMFTAQQAGYNEIELVAASAASL